MYNDIVDAREHETSHTVLTVRGGVYVEVPDTVCVCGGGNVRVEYSGGVCVWVCVFGCVCVCVCVCECVWFLE